MQSVKVRGMPDDKVYSGSTSKYEWPRAILSSFRKVLSIGPKYIWMLNYSFKLSLYSSADFHLRYKTVTVQDLHYDYTFIAEKFCI